MDRIYYKTSQAAKLVNGLIEDGFPIYAGKDDGSMAILSSLLTLRPSATTGTKMYFYKMNQYYLLFSGNTVPHIAIQDHLYPLFEVNADQEWTPLYKIYHPTLRAEDTESAPISQIMVRIKNLKHIRKGQFLYRDSVSLPILDVDNDQEDPVFITYGDPIQGPLYYGPVYQEEDGLKDTKGNPIHIFMTYLIP